MFLSTFRLVLRIPGAWQFANTCVILNRTKNLQGYQCLHGINHLNKESAQKGISDSMELNRKRKTGTPVWREMSTQSSPNNDGSVEEVVTDATNIASISTDFNDVLKDSNDVSGDSLTSSVAQSIDGIQDAEKMTISKKKHAVSVEIGTSVMRFIMGKDRSTQKEIESMGVIINFPKHAKKLKEHSIVIEGDSMDNIAKASQKIKSVIDEAAKSPRLSYSHFISIPLGIHPEFVGKVTKFQCSILGCDDLKHVNESSEATASGDADKVDPPEKDLAVVEDDINRVKVDINSIPIVNYGPIPTKSPTLYEQRIDAKIFLKPQRVHLTVLMLKLWNNERLRAAIDVLQDVCPKVDEVLDNRPLFVRLKGLDVLRGNTAKAQVVYAPVEEIGDEGRLTRACQIITDAYVRAGLVLEKDARQKLKLHATLMNTTFRRGRNMKKGFDSFNARHVLQQFGSEEWGDYHIREAHLSQRFVYDDNGYYHCCASIPLPGNTQILESSTEPEKAEVEETPMVESA